MNDTTPLPTTPIEPEAEPRRPFSPRPILIGVGSAVAVLALGVGGFAVADTLRVSTDDRIVITSSPSNSASPSPSGSPSDDSDSLQPSDAEYSEVTAAALAAVGGGTVIEVDRGDSPGDAAWKVEIRLANGDEAEVRLDANLNVIRVDLDNDDNSGSDDSESDDSGSDDSGSDDSDDDNSGSGSDDSGSDDSGSGSDDD